MPTSIPATTILRAFLTGTSLSTALLVSEAHAQSVPASQAAPRTENVVVTGRNPVESANGVTGRAPGGGLMSVQTVAREQSTVTRDLIAKLSPSTTAAQIIQNSPGTNVATSDPFGFSDQTNVTVRGLNQDEIGYLYEGLPISDIDTYLPYASEWGDAENYQEVSLAQGTVDLDAPLINSAGGELSVLLRDPPEHPGGLLDYSFGSHKTNREFLRVDLGTLGASGIQGYLSYSNATYGTWRGPGRGQRRHVDSVFEKNWGDGNKIKYVVGYNENNQPEYTDVTLGQYQQYRNSYNYDGTPTSPEDTNYWQLAEGAWRNLNMSVPSHFTLNSRLSVDVTPYFYWGSGGGGGGSVINESGNYYGTEFVTLPLNADRSLVQPDGTLLAQTYFVIQEFHAGLNAHLDYRLGDHDTLTFGSFYDYYDDRQEQGYAQPAANGNPPNYWGSNILKFSNGQTLYGEDYHLTSQINGIYVGDTLSLLGDKLELKAGFKEVVVGRTGTNNLPGPQYDVAANSAQPLPRFSARYNFNPANMIFVDASANFRVPAAYSYFNSYSGTGFYSQGNTSLKDEFSIEEEIGYRYQASVDFDVTAFNYNFTNRNISTIEIENGAQVGRELNVGGQTVRGIDAEAGLHPFHHISPYVSGEYLYATTNNNFQVAGDYLPTTGKIAVRSPRWQTTAGLSYDDGTFFGNLIYRWVDSQFGDFMNEERIPAHNEADATLGIRLPNIGFAKHPQVQLNLYNLGGASYLSGVATPSANAKTTVGVFGTQIAGTSPTYFIASNFAAMVTFTTGF